MDGAVELILTVPHDHTGQSAIEFLRYEGGADYSCEFVESLRSKLEGTKAAEFLERIPVAYYLFRVPEGFETEIAERLRRDFNGEGGRPGRILFAEVNRPMQLLQATPNFNLGGQHSAYRKMMNVPDAHSAGVTGSGRRIAIIDSGVEPAHASVVTDMIDGLQNPVRRAAPLHDDLGHGTAMAVMAHDIAPDARIYAVRICAKNSAVNPYGVMAGVFIAAADCAAHVVNLSLGFDAIRKCRTCGASGAVRSFALESAMRTAQLARAAGGPPVMLYTASVGNSGIATGLDHPARYACAIPVGSVDSAGNRSAFSNYDRANCHTDHIMAPGGQTSAQNVTEEVGSWRSTGEQCYGTSGATAYASGMLALLWSDPRYANLDAGSFLAAVKASHCHRQPSQRVDEYGCGLIRYDAPASSIASTSGNASPAAAVEYVEDGIYVGDVFLEINNNIG